MSPVRRNVFPSRAAGCAEARRVFKPAGHFVFEVWDRLEDSTFACDVTDAAAALLFNSEERLDGADDLAGAAAAELEKFTTRTCRLGRTAA